MSMTEEYKEDGKREEIAPVGEEETMFDMEDGRPSWRERLAKLWSPVRSIQDSLFARQLRIALLLVIGIMIGIAVKTEAAQRLTIGFQDYTVAQGGAQYDLNALEEKVAQEQASGNGTQQAVGLPGGAACGQ